MSSERLQFMLILVLIFLIPTSMVAQVAIFDPEQEAHLREIERAELTKRIQQNPQDIEAYVRRANILAAPEIRLQDLNKIIEIQAPSLDLKDHYQSIHATAFLDRAKLYQQQKEDTSLIRLDFLASARLYPSKEAYYQLAYIAHRNQEYESAKDYYKKAIQHSNSFFGRRQLEIQLAQVYIYLNRREDALKVHQDRTQVVYNFFLKRRGYNDLTNRSSVVYQYSHDQAKFRSDYDYDTEGTIRLITKTLDSIDLYRPITTSKDLYFLRGELHWKLNKKEKAYADWIIAEEKNLHRDFSPTYDFILNAHPKDAEVYVIWALTSLNKHNYDGGRKRYCLQALDFFNTAYELGYSGSALFYNRAYCYKELGRYEEALEDMHTAIDQAPDNYLFYYRRAQIYWSLKDKENSEADTQKAEEIKRMQFSG